MSPPVIDPWLLPRLACPRHRLPLAVSRDDVEQTLWVASESLEMVRQFREGHSIGIDQPPTASGIDPQVQSLVAHTCGYLYAPLVNQLTEYPIPQLRLPSSSGQVLLDIGCGWGRWSIAAARKGYRPIGLDPSLRHALAAQRVSRQLAAACHFVVADARYLPFAARSLDVVFSYSVLQHFSKVDARTAFQSIGQVLKAGGTSFIQMPNAFGMRSLYHQARRGFGPGVSFEVRYWTPRELAAAFSDAIGPASLSVDGFFGLGIQKSDIAMLRPQHRLVVHSSEALRWLADRIPALSTLADSLYVTARRPEDRGSDPFY
jgi:SAM-dependent methyltransferase